MSKNICRWCKREFDKPVRKKGWTFCPHCEGTEPLGFNHSANVEPLKHSRDWYKGKWFKKNDKEWKKDIKSRRRQPDGSVIRVNEKGKRIT